MRPGQGKTSTALGLLVGTSRAQGNGDMNPKERRPACRPWGDCLSPRAAIAAPTLVRAPAEPGPRDGGHEKPRIPPRRDNLDGGHREDVGRREQARRLPTGPTPPHSTMPGRKPYRARKVAVRLPSTVERQASSVICATGAGRARSPPAHTATTAVGPSYRSGGLG